MILRVEDLQKKNKEKSDMKKKAFTEILQECYKKISMKNNLGLNSTTFDIPMVHFGYPLYNPSEVMNFIIKKLQKGGFKVYIHATTLIITWDVQKPKSALKQPKKKVRFKDNIEETFVEPPVKRKENTGRLNAKDIKEKLKQLEQLREIQLWG